MKQCLLAVALAVCLVMGGCGLFSAAVTRPTQPPQPVQQAPATQPATQPTTEPTTQPTTEPTTVPVEDLPEVAVVGQWKMDSLYTTEQGVSIRDLYGTAIREGEGMTFYGDGTFSYFAGACHGEGTYALDGDRIRVKLTNQGKKAVTIREYQKISQMVILPIITPELQVVDHLEETERGNGGFGSSGKF
jgi:uncharacterized protein YceK